MMHSSLKASCLWFLLFALWWASPTLAESDHIAGSDQKIDEEKVGSPEQSKETLPLKHIPFAQYEEELKNSERWETLSPEEQEEALAKIEHYRKLFRERQAELHDHYNKLLKKKSKKRKSLSRRHRDLEEQNFEAAWAKWQKLPPFRQKELSKKWKIRITTPSKQQEEFLKVWNKLLPTTRTVFFRNLR